MINGSANAALNNHGYKVLTPYINPKSCRRGRLIQPTFQHQEANWVNPIPLLLLNRRVSAKLAPAFILLCKILTHQKNNHKTEVA